MLLQTQGTVRLVADAEVKFSNEKSKLVEFRVAANERVKNGDNWEERPSFYTVKHWVHANSKLPDFLKKGTQAFIVGTVVEERWETEEGKRSKLVISANEIELVGGKASNTDSAPAQNSTPAAQSAPSQEAPAVDVDEDEIPF